MTSFFGTVKDGNLTLDDRPALDEELSKLEGDVELTVGKVVRGRSVKANARYWALLREGERETGQSAESLHEIAKSLFAKQMKQAFDTVYETVGSTALMDTRAFEEYVNRVELWLMEHGISLNQ